MENQTHADEEVHPAATEGPSSPTLSDGRDELNLAEFPLSAIADRLHSALKTIRFEDRIWDEQRGEMITRQLTITASDDHGLPTALDDEVILGLIQLSKLQHFVDREVHFTRYQLLQLLDWRDESKSYARLETSINRWAGVTLYYQNAWWSKDEQCWVDEKFHILDNVTLYDLDKLKRRRQAARQPMLPLSSFRWNEVIFRSFQAGNLKSIDFDFYKRLNSAVAKRLYRFLDKRFFHRPRWEFNLKEFCWEHVGLSRHYDTANLKRKLRPAIQELERQGFLQTVSEVDCFRKVRSGEWRIVFEKATVKIARDDAGTAPDATLEKALIERGVSPSVARETVATFSPERIHPQLQVFDWLHEQHDAKVIRNPPGFLISSIKSEYAPPRGFVSRAEQELHAKKTAARRQQLAMREQAILATQEAKQQAREAEIARFWQSLSKDERLRLEQEALAQSPAFQRELAAQEGKLGAAARKNLLDAYALKMLQAGV